jgi:hypothetical protein
MPLVTRLWRAAGSGRHAWAFAGREQESTCRPSNNGRSVEAGHRQGLPIKVVVVASSRDRDCASLATDISWGRTCSAAISSSY